MNLNSKIDFSTIISKSNKLNLVCINKIYEYYTRHNITYDIIVLPTKQ